MQKTTKKPVLIGADHAGAETKELIKRILKEMRIPFEDLGTQPGVPCDYPVIAGELARRVVKEKTKGILLCGSGTGMMIAANKVRGTRAALAYDEYSARMARRDNDANILTLRSREFPRNRYRPILKAWFTTRFADNERYRRRLRQIAQLEKK